MPLGQPIVRRDVVDSTSSEAQRLAEAGAAHGTLVLARAQTAGRGRRGRTWMALDGEQLYMSLVLRPALAAERAAELTLVAAVALAEALETHGADPRIKWPNDLELNGRKVAGLLCEMATDAAGRLRHVVVGVGVNLEGEAASLPEEIRDRATTLQAVHGHQPAPEALAVTFCERFEAWLDCHAREGLAPALEAWRRRCSTLGEAVKVTLGPQTFEGNAIDVAEDGALVVETEGRRVVVQAGELTMLRRMPAGG
jgi:BirA family biotin operon repressor/biotin-[acetyl-CoA-carboxylase] ligase